jgi:hypothetical protein
MDEQDSDTEGVPIANNVVPSSSRSRQSRLLKKDAKDKLPAVFWIYNVAQTVLMGACLITCCLPGTSDDRAKWEISRLCLLQEAQKKDKSKYKYLSSAFELTGSFELEMRMSSCSLGGTINSHFLDFVAKTWRVIGFDIKTCSSMMQHTGDILYVETKHSVCISLGIVPSTSASNETQLEATLAEHVEDELGAHKAWLTFD